MRFSAEEFRLKDNRTVVMRTPQKEDADAMLTFLEKSYAETDFMGRCPEDKMISQAEEEKFLDKCYHSENNLHIAVFDGERIIANAGIYFMSGKKKVCHRAGLGMAVLKEYWSQGIGSQLLQECQKAAKIMGYEQIELEVVAENESAVHLYKKFGFIEYGRLPHAQKLREGVYQEYCLMVCFL